MMGAEGLATAARQVGLVAEGLIRSLGDDGLVAAQQDALGTTVARLWSVANGSE